MVLKSYAKVNLSLSIYKRNLKNLHEIQSLFCLVNLFDKIKVKKNNKKFDKIVFKGPFSRFVSNSDNSIKRILNILRMNKLLSNYYSIEVTKNIPVFGGLGGGSSNAASIIKFLVKKKIKKKFFNNIVKNIGSDLRLFFYNLGYLDGLEKVVKLKNKQKLYFLLAFPKIKCSTKDIYSKVKRYSTKKIFLQKNFKQKDKFINYIVNAQNDLQSIVEKRFSIVGNLLTNIRKEQGCYTSRMTGSGSVCYGLFSNEYCSKVALKSLKKRYPKFWFSVAKTI